MNLFAVDPIRKFVTNKAGAVEVCSLETYSAAPSVANDQEIIAAVSGKRHRIMGLLTQGVAAAGGMSLWRAASSSLILSLTTPASTADPFVLPIVDSGYSEGTTGAGIFLNVTTNQIRLTIWYITYTP